MAYESWTWYDSPSTESPLNSTNLNHLDLGIAGIYSNVGELSNLTTSNKTSIVNASNENTTSINTNRVNLNNLRNYSSSETAIGQWIDGKTIYRKVINFGNLPNATTKQIAHNISNLGRIIKISGMAFNANTNTSIPLPYVSNTVTQNVQLYVTSTNVVMTTGFNFSIYTTSYIIIEYVKNS